MKKRIAIKVLRRLALIDARRDGSPELCGELVRRAVARLGRATADQVYADELERRRR